MEGGPRQSDGSYFAPAERTAPAVLEREIEFVGNSPIVQALLRSVGGLLAVLDERRQILAVNDELLAFLGCSDAGRALGLRPGEVLECVHSREEPGGCGTSQYCSTCGNAIAIVSALKGTEPVERKCALRVLRNGRTLDLCLRVRCTPLDLGSERVLLLFLQDITHLEDEAALEKTFLHDLSNVVTCLSSVIPPAPDSSPEDMEELGSLVGRLRREIELHRAMINGLSTELTLRSSEVALDALLHTLRETFAHHPIAHDRTLSVTGPPPGATLVTDRTVVERILCNMLTNAFEASPPGAEVRLRARCESGTWHFDVWNAGVIPEAVQLRIFQKHYSTKQGEGRGLGTYGMKLLAEKLLGGHVYFTSTPAEGTTFHLEFAP